MDIIFEGWSWYVAGPSIGILAFLLYWAGENFGFSSNLRHFCSILGAGKRSDFFKYDWKKFKWSYVFVVGSVAGGFIAASFLTAPDYFVAISENTVTDLATLGFTNFEGMVPNEIFSWENIFTIRNMSIIVLGGFLVGFGTRYAGGCTSGHAISGLSNFQLPSLIAVIGFFIGGLFATHILFPLIF